MRQHIDHAWNTARELVQAFDGPVADQRRPVVATLGQAEVEVLANGGARQGFQIVGEGNALTQLPEPVLITQPPVFDWLKKAGNIDAHEMYRTFNCGIGLVLVVPASEQEDILSQLKASGESPVVMGQVEQRTGDAVIIDGV